ncbi:grainyhead-like protein 2 homolog [Betta splendens]|uniref:Grainyhead-like protein 2 homolog n=1 Tax=Betta splendens TaxID=158456 RepID=A0A6P7KS33_BETSP|nr:grainyhead-like protein 2 homolog [Betta splendens]
MDLDSKRLVLVVPSDVPVSSRQVFDSDDETWTRRYLENPLTAATKAMMSINGDEDSSAVLGLLYDYYKAPKEKRLALSCTKPTDLSAVGSNNYGHLEIQDHHLQALRSTPVNLSLNNTAAQHRGSGCVEDAHDGGNEDALALVKTEDQVPMTVSCSGGYVEPRDRVQGAYEQRPGDLRHAGYMKSERRSTVERAYEDSVEEMYHRRPSTGTDSFHCSLPVASFQYSLEASMSMRPRQGEGPMAYLNRGQFYPLTLSATGLRSSLCQQRVKVQTAIMVVFGKDKCRDEQLKNWKYWHSHQHTAKQRVLDIADYKESFSTVGNVEEIAYNAVSFTWDVTEEAKVFISVNCLSTDFSSQKGVKGTPLIIQIDTYAYNSCSSRPIHRAFAQIKVFCDKGAERKLRDEEKKQLRKKLKGKSGISSSSPIRRGDSTLFKTVADLETQPVLFIPGVHFGNLQRAGQVFALNTEEVDRDGGVVMKRMPCVGEDDVCPSPPKKPKVEQERKVLLYVRKESDEVFDALMLHSPTLKALMQAISEKYAVPVDKMAKVYQKSKKGVLVNMDDNIIQHYSNEDTFILAIESSAETLRVTLSEI